MLSDSNSPIIEAWDQLLFIFIFILGASEKNLNGQICKGHHLINTQMSVCRKLQVPQCIWGDDKKKTDSNVTHPILQPYIAYLGRATHFCRLWGQLCIAKISNISSGMPFTFTPSLSKMRESTQNPDV